MGWVNEVAAEIDRLVVATYSGVGMSMGAEWAFPNAHPALLQGVGAALLDGPVPLGGLQATYPYLPESMLEGLVANNVAEGVISLAEDVMTLTEAGRVGAEQIRDAFVAVPQAMWADRPTGEVATLATEAASHGKGLEPLVHPSAFALQAPLLDGSLFRAINALRYWRADAHRAAWGAAGLTVKEAQALNVLWDKHRNVQRVGQGDPRPGRTGLTALSDKGLAADEQITDLGIRTREAIESDTDVRAEPIFAPLDDAQRVALLTGLRELPIR